MSLPQSVRRGLPGLAALASLLLLPTPAEAAPRRPSSTPVRPDLAIQAWKVSPKKNETTAALEQRVQKDLKKLLALNQNRIDSDSSRWKLLNYLRELPWESMPEFRKTWYLANMPNPRLTDEQRQALIDSLKSKPIFKMTPKEIDVYIGWLQEAVPDLRRRIVHIARQNLGQPYAIYLLGEFPAELYDPDPTFCLEKGDCVVFSEHVYSMALSRNWEEFYRTLQKIRYKDGVVGMTTRNHFTEADWNKNNSWLVEDVTEELGATTVTQYREKIDRARFFSNFGIGQDIPVEILKDSYIPAEAIPSVLDKLQDGDFVNIVRGIGEGVWVGHVGLIGHREDGTVTFIHSTEPKSKEQPLMEYVTTNLEKNVQRARKGTAQFKGMKFLRLKAEELQKGREG